MTIMIQRAKVLIIIRNKAMGQLVSNVILQSGYATNCVNNARQAQSVFSREKFAAVIMDANLPNAQSADQSGSV